MAVRILIADDHPVVRHGLRTLLAEHEGWEVIAEAGDGIEAVAMADQLKPDVVVLDLSMPRMHGLEACRLIRERTPESEILIVTQHDSPQMMQEALLCGARGYVVKTDAARDLLEAVDAVSRHKDFTLLGKAMPPPDGQASI
jgi:DNA-binding NarL/FixJ family response regulator